MTALPEVEPGPEDWTEPGCHEVLPCVHRLPLPMPQDGLRAVNVYLVEGPDGHALVDAGWRVPGNLDLLREGLGARGITLEDVRDVFVTHIHRDHYTLAAELRRHAGTAVHLGEGERAGLHLVRAQGDNQPTSSLHQLRRSGAGDLAGEVAELLVDDPWEARDWELPDHWTTAGPVSIGGRTMEAVAVPGHTKGHLVFHDRALGVVFTGDHVLPTITPSIGFELGEWDLPLGRYLASLELLLERPDATVLPAHGHPGGSLHARVRALLAHHDDRLAATARCVRDGARTALEVARGLTWTRRGRTYKSLDPFNRMIAVCETLAHLDVLADRGEAVVAAGPGGVAAFSPR